ncbi:MULTISPECIES: DNA mismatch repair endonuclease MutL [Calditerrivibrio]|uniref:DNA mismatch repair endonuclease MutL n=1 Tax=Calditerrivibrio TaxID=545865 RepID=UPI003C783A97
MPSEIIKLPSDISNKIAAGEVVERPFNVVKELLENSIDAGADKIDIEINDGGLSLIKVSDNGRGILPDDLPNTIERYATSKIKRFEDIYSINSYGFRGEALAAISSVSDFKIHSRRDCYDGFVLIKNFGENFVIKPSPIPYGTTVEVANLFQKIPVRKKFLKNSNSEYREILKFIKCFASINFNVTLKLIKDGEVVLDLIKDNCMIDRVKKIFNEAPLFEFKNRYGTLNIEGVLSTPDNQKFRKDYIITSVNKRIIKDFGIMQSIINAYHRLIPENRYPFAFINLNISGEDLDVNVHPTKMAVKFFNSNDIFSFVYDSIKTELNRLTLSSSYVTQSNQEADKKDEIYKTTNPELKYNIDLEKILSSEKEISVSESYANYSDADKEIKIIGQLFKTVILCEIKDELVFIDQHIAHERVLFEKYKNLKNSIPSVVLYEPIIMDVSYEDREILSTNMEILNKFGFEIEFFGKDSLKISSIPSSLLKRDPVEELKNIIEEINSLKVAENDKIPLIMSCKNAIKSGDYLTYFEMEELVTNLFKTSNPYTCPHGRPIIFKMNKESIYKKFHR